jgi:hypothetical protein
MLAMLAWFQVLRRFEINRIWIIMVGIEIKRVKIKK